MAVRIKDTQRAHIDALVEWYEKFKPGQPRRIPTNFTAEQLRVILSKSMEDLPAKEYFYRGHTILAKGVEP